VETRRCWCPSPGAVVPASPSLFERATRALCCRSSGCPVNRSRCWRIGSQVCRRREPPALASYAHVFHAGLPPSRLGEHIDFSGLTTTSEELPPPKLVTCFRRPFGGSAMKEHEASHLLKRREDCQFDPSRGYTSSAGRRDRKPNGSPADSGYRCLCKLLFRSAWRFLAVHAGLTRPAVGFARSPTRPSFPIQVQWPSCSESIFS
jgi:hypothetical protein